ncbi:MAG: NAD(P)-binding protein [Kiritimatiellae bacterium]|nr:NAD(P)-binding protein [Kiritimatiellia bacterium]
MTGSISQNPETDKMRIAVVGTGAAGLTAAWLLQRKHRIDLYEKNHYIGGHTRTRILQDGPDAGTPIDTGFIVMNHANYPLLTKILDQLKIPLGDSDMSFSFHCEQTGYAYAGTNLGSLFVQRSNLWNGSHWRMLIDILRFNASAIQNLSEGHLSEWTLGIYLAQKRYSRAFKEQYLFPMCSAIWSASTEKIESFPAQSVLQFFDNHGLLSINKRPQWKYVKDGSHEYVKAMLKTIKGKKNLNTPIEKIFRHENQVILHLKDGSSRTYDAVVVGTHADEALELLGDASPQEERLLGAWKYQTNETVLHTDPSVMPPLQCSWASWNFRRNHHDRPETPVSVTYDMNRLQQPNTQEKYFVTLNNKTRLAASKIIDQTTFTHPINSFQAMATQDKLPLLNGVKNTYFCGSYFGYGFHEDAVCSAVNIAKEFGIYV